MQLSLKVERQSFAPSYKTLSNTAALTHTHTHRSYSGGEPASPVVQHVNNIWRDKNTLDACLLTAQPVLSLFVYVWDKTVLEILI